MHFKDTQVTFHYDTIPKTNATRIPLLHMMNLCIKKLELQCVKLEEFSNDKVCNFFQELQNRKPLRTMKE